MMQDTILMRVTQYDFNDGPDRLFGVRVYMQKGIDSRKSRSGERTRLGPRKLTLLLRQPSPCP